MKLSTWLQNLKKVLWKGIHNKNCNVTNAVVKKLYFPTGFLNSQNPPTSDAANSLPNDLESQSTEQTDKSILILIFMTNALSRLMLRRQKVQKQQYFVQR